MHLLDGDPLVSAFLKVLFYEYVLTEDKDIPGILKVVSIKIYRVREGGILIAPNPSSKWKDR